MSKRTPLSKRVYSALSWSEWRKTQDIAQEIGCRDLKAVRDMLYAMELEYVVEHRAQHNGHLWRKAVDPR